MNIFGILQDLYYSIAMGWWIVNADFNEWFDIFILETYHIEYGWLYSSRHNNNFTYQNSIDIFWKDLMCYKAGHFTVDAGFPKYESTEEGR
jgi:hypothetical protein